MEEIGKFASCLRIDILVSDSNQEKNSISSCLWIWWIWLETSKCGMFHTYLQKSILGDCKLENQTSHVVVIQKYYPADTYCKGCIILNKFQWLILRHRIMHCNQWRYMDYNQWSLNWKMSQFGCKKKDTRYKPGINISNITRSNNTYKYQRTFFVLSSN